MSRRVRLDALYEPLTAEQDAALREDIRKRGVVNPILVTPAGVIVAGHNRKRIADELGLPCPEAIFDGGPAEQIQAAVLSNPQRRVSACQRGAIASRLRELGWSNVRTAEHLGVDEKTIRNDLARSSSEKSEGRPEAPRVREVTGRDGRRYSAERFTSAQVERRRMAVARLYREGYKFEAIGEALGIHGSVCSRDAQTLGLKRRRHKALRAGVPAPLDWRTDPVEAAAKPRPIEAVPLVAPQPPAYRTSIVIADTRHWVECFAGGDFPNRLAWNLYEAGSQGDEEWLDYTRRLIEKAHEQAGRLLRVLTDADYRDACMHGTELEVRTSSEDVPTLRVIR